MTTRELEELLGQKVTAKMEFVLVGGRLFHRTGPERWDEYDPPEPDGERALAA